MHGSPAAPILALTQLGRLALQQPVGRQGHQAGQQGRQLVCDQGSHTVDHTRHPPICVHARNGREGEAIPLQQPRHLYLSVIKAVRWGGSRMRSVSFVLPHALLHVPMNVWAGSTTSPSYSCFTPGPTCAQGQSC